MHIENGYYNKDYSFLGKCLFETAIVLLVMKYFEVFLLSGFVKSADHSLYINDQQI